MRIYEFASDTIYKFHTYDTVFLFHAFYFFPLHMHVLVIARQKKEKTEEKKNSNETPKKTDFLSTEKSDICEGLQAEYFNGMKKCAIFL